VLTDIARSYNVSHSTISRLSYRKAPVGYKTSGGNIYALAMNALACALIAGLIASAEARNCGVA
jgi:hypothetical protein